MPVLLRVFHLGVGECGLAARTPIDNAASAVDEPLLIETEERFAHRFGTFFVHRERQTRPIAGRAELFKLFDDAPAVLFLPRPCAAKKFFPAEFLFGKPLFFHLFHDFDFRGDGSVVRSRQPERAVALHTFETHEDILHRLVHGVTHVQLARNVGGRHHDGERHLRGVDLGAEAALLHPCAVNLFFKLSRIVRRLHLFHCFLFS